jgi:hypothetical protein
LKLAEKSRTNPEKVSVGYMEGKFFAAILNKRQKGVRCKVKGVL